MQLGTVKELLEILTAAGVVDRASADKVRSAATRNPRPGEHPIETCVRLELLAASGQPISDDALSEWYAGHLGVPFYRIDPLKIELTVVTEVVSENYAQAHGILPVEVKGREVLIATPNPMDTSWMRPIEEHLGKKIKLVFASPREIRTYLSEFYSLARSVRSATTAGAGQSKSLINSFEQLVEMGRDNKAIDANDQHVTRIVDWLWRYAFDQKASDIHIEPRRELGLVRFRIDGILHQVYQMPLPVMQAAVSRIKILSRIDIMEKRRPQDGRIKTKNLDGREIELRVSTMPTAFGEKMVMRIFDPRLAEKDYGHLGLDERDMATWREMIGKPNGIVLVTGPTGSGKTTTLYATLRELATSENNVCTVEDPIEMIDSRLNQTQIQPSIDFSFSEGIRALMRQDPDIIMVGEIRDRETAEMAIQAALTGHLVLSTLHTNDAPSSITRLVDLGVPPYLINATFNGIMAQRLIRALCPSCKRKAPISEDGLRQWKKLTAPFDSKPPTHVHEPVGCLECRNTGYRGRIGIYEVLPLDRTLHLLLERGASTGELRDAALRQGCLPLRVAGAKKIALGLVDFTEVEKVVPPYDG